MEIRDHRESNGKSHGMENRRFGDTDEAEQGHEDAGDERFTDPTQTKARHGHAQLASGEIGVKMADHMLRELGASRPCFYKGFDLG